MLISNIFLFCDLLCSSGLLCLTKTSFMSHNHLAVLLLRLTAHLYLPHTPQSPQIHLYMYVNSLLVIEGDAKDLGDVDLRLQALLRLTLLLAWVWSNTSAVHSSTSRVLLDVPSTRMSPQWGMMSWSAPKSTLWVKRDILEKQPRRSWKVSLMVVLSFSTIDGNVALAPVDFVALIIYDFGTFSWPSRCLDAF